jgi:hypothetical protein
MRVLISLLLGLLSFQANGAGLDPWRFGMSRAEVASFQQYGPYQDVRVTGGIETFNGVFDGRKANIAFDFDDRGLRRIHIFVYEGRDLDQAVRAWKSTYDYLQRTYGEVETPTIKVGAQSEPVNSEVLSIAARMEVSLVGKVQMAPKPMPSDTKVFSSFFKREVQAAPYYYVFLYFNRP